MVEKRSREDAIKAFGDRAEQPPARTAGLTVRNAVEGEPAWKQRNREPKHSGVMIRVSESQLELLRMASKAEELSQQKVVERILWPVLEERYGNG